MFVETEKINTPMIMYLINDLNSFPTFLLHIKSSPELIELSIIFYQFYHNTKTILIKF